jgi:hypothetical protein
VDLPDYIVIVHKGIEYMSTEDSKNNGIKRDFKAIKIMADYGIDAYAWAVADPDRSMGGGSCGSLVDYFPELPEVKDADKALADWWLKFACGCNDSCDPTFPFEDFHDEGVALAERLAKVIKHTGIRVFYDRPWEDLNTSPAFEVGEGISKPPKRLFEILNKYRCGWIVDEQHPENVAYHFEASDIPIIEEGIRESLEPTVGSDIVNDLIGRFHEAIKGVEEADRESYIIQLVWGDKYTEAPSGNEFFQKIRNSFLGAAGGRFNDVLRRFTAYPGIMYFIPDSMVGLLETDWAHQRTNEYFEIIEDFLWIFIGGARSWVYQMTRDIDLADAAGYLLWDILQEWKVPDKDCPVYLIKDERENSRCDRTVELINRFRAGLKALCAGKHRCGIDRFCSLERIDWIGRWRNEKGWVISDDTVKAGLEEVIKKIVVENLDSYCWNIWKPIEEWKDELTAAIMEYAKNNSQGKMRVDEQWLRNCIESKVLYDEMFFAKIVSLFKDCNPYADEGDYIAGRLINEIVESGAIVWL